MSSRDRTEEPATLEIRIEAQLEGERLDLVLGGRAEIGSRAAAQRLIDCGAVLVDGRPRPKRHRVAVGERVEVRLAPRSAGPAATPGAVETPYEVALEDDHLIVVDKPAGVVVHPAPAHPTGTLAQTLAARAAGGPDPGRAGIVHRLDRDTSGLMVVAKSEAVHRALQQALRARALEREYLTLIEGTPESRSGTVDAPLGRDRHDPTSVALRSDAGRSARTHFTVEEALARTTLLRVRLETGRTHQIRVHMASIGHPVCGDARYGGRACGRPLGLERQFLHSTRLRFSHPIDGTPVDTASALPGDLLDALALARAQDDPPGDRRPTP